jgi:hypothetical protein
MERRRSAKEDGSVSLGRHEHHCRVCSHPRWQEIEQEWIGWGRTSRIAEHYHIRRDSHYRHAHALPGLFKQAGGTESNSAHNGEHGFCQSLLSPFKPHCREDFTLAIAGTREPETI